MPFDTKAMPARSCFRCHFAPFTPTPSAKVESISVKANDSVFPLSHPQRANAVTFRVRFCSRLTPKPYLRVMCQGWFVISGTVSGSGVDAHIGVVRVGEQTHDARFFRYDAMTQLVFPIPRVNLPRPPHQIDSIRNL